MGVTLPLPEAAILRPLSLWARPIPHRKSQSFQGSACAASNEEVMNLEPASSRPEF